MRRVGFAKPSMKIPKGGGGHGPPESKKKDTRWVSFFLARPNAIDATEKHLNKTKKGTVIRLAANDWSRQPSAALVPVAGLEPARLAALDFESSTSTNSITPASAWGIILHFLPKRKGHSLGFSEFSASSPSSRSRSATVSAIRSSIFGDSMAATRFA